MGKAKKRAAAATVFPLLLGAAMVTLKLAGFQEIPWSVALLPFWLPVALLLFGIAVTALAAFLIRLVDSLP
jgi:hypothetical protein